MDSFELVVDSISFAYDKNQPNIFSNLSFSVKALIMFNKDIFIVVV